MKESTIKNKFGNLSKKEENALLNVHYAFLDTTKEGLSIDVLELVSLLKEYSKDPSRKKEVRTIESILARMDSQHKIHPEYDIFREGRAPIYSVFPNLPDTIPPTIFNEVLIPVPHKGNLIDTLVSVSDSLSKGWRLGPVIGKDIYLRVA